MASPDNHGTSPGFISRTGHHYMARITAQNLSSEDFDPYEMQEDSVQQNPSSSYIATPGIKDQVVHTTSEKRVVAAPAPQPSWRPWTTKTPREKMNDNLRKRYRGKWGFHNMRRVFLPRTPANSDPETVVQDHEAEFHRADTWQDPKGEVVKTKDGKYEFRNEFHTVDAKYRDTAVYLSPTNTIPRRLVVQSARDVLQSMEAGAETGDWIRTRMKGSVPTVLKMSEWALGPLEKKGWWHTIDALGRMLIISFPLQCMLAIPGMAAWESDGGMADSYTDHPGYHWDWPKYAINVLDEAPGIDGLPQRKAFHKHDVRRRAIRPTKIVVRVGDTDEWRVEEAKNHPSVRYIFISYMWRQFCHPNGQSDLARIYRMAQQITTEKGYRAYWLDIQCTADTSQHLELDYDVYTMCDIVRGAGLVAILLGSNTERARYEWGTRLWTLPEGMLAPGESLTWCYETSPGGKLFYDEVHKVEMTATFWGDPPEAVNQQLNQSESQHLNEEMDTDNPIRTLAEHYSGLLTLSRLELLPSLISALASRGWTNKENIHSDLSYAVMGFLHYRLERNVDDTLFQSLARLSLANDNDQIVERMISVLPKPSSHGNYLPGKEIDNSDLFRVLSHPDQFETRVHDITPLCDVVGVAHEDDTVIVDNCKAIHIRWKNFPRPIVQRHQGFKKAIATFFVAAGLWWLMWGFNLTITWLPFWSDLGGDVNVKTNILAWIVGGFVLVAITLSAAAPFSVRRLFGGKVEKSSPNLVGFEGVMPIHDLEKVIFGNADGRLTYAPSSTPFCALRHARHVRERKGYEPSWVKDASIRDERLRDVLPAGHHLFTLVDMGDLSVSIFSAERPPTVALLCGREGGMVRAALCSWRFENDCLYKETVMRFSSTVYEAATPKDWLKLCLQTQNQARWKRLAGLNKNAHVIVGAAQ